MDLASRVAGEKLGAPVASVNFAPGVLWSVYDSPRLKGRIARSAGTEMVQAASVRIVRPMFRAPAAWPGAQRPAQASWVCRRVKRIFTRLVIQSDLVLGLFPDWFGPPQPDWPANTPHRRLSAVGLAR